VAVTAPSWVRGVLVFLATMAGGGAVAADMHSPIPIVVTAVAGAAVGMFVWKRDARRKPKPVAVAIAPELPEAYAARVTKLEERTRAIIAAAEQNRNFDGGLMRTELDELAQLVTGFRDIAAACARWERHLESTDFDELEADLRRHETDAERAVDGTQRDLARQNLRVLLARKDQLGEIRRKVAHAKGQLDLLENSFRLVTDEVLAMQSPTEIKGKLDELLAGVEAVRETTRDTAPRAAVQHLAAAQRMK
jgi:hypothetical protein